MIKVWVPVAYGSALVSYNFAQQVGWSFARSGAPRAKLLATWWENARAARLSLPTLPEGGAHILAQLGWSFVRVARIARIADGAVVSIKILSVKVRSINLSNLSLN